MDNNKPILEVKNMCKEFSQRKGFFNINPQKTLAVSDVSFKVFEGESLGIIGQSGSGKTTLARILIGLEEPTSGEFLLNGLQMQKRRPIKIRKQLQMVFQDSTSTLSPKMKIKNILKEPLKLHFPKIMQPEIDKKMSEMLDQVRMPHDSLEKYPHELSGGQQQRINIAKAMIIEPEIIIFDEPTSSLDVSVQAQILNLLKELRKEKKITYIFITHDMGVVNFISDNLIVMNKGKIVERGATTDIINSPKNSYTKKLMNAVLDIDPNNRRYIHRIV